MQRERKQKSPSRSFPNQTLYMAGAQWMISLSEKRWKRERSRMWLILAFIWLAQLIRTQFKCELHPGGNLVQQGAILIHLTPLQVFTPPPIPPHRPCWHTHYPACPYSGWDLSVGNFMSIHMQESRDNSEETGVHPPGKAEWDAEVCKHLNPLLLLFEKNLLRYFRSFEIFLWEIFF